MANDKISGMTAATVGQVSSTLSAFEISVDLGGTPTTKSITPSVLRDQLETQAWAFDSTVTMASTLAVTGAATFTTSVSGRNAIFTQTAASTYAIQGIGRNSTGDSLGLNVDAGTNSSDFNMNMRSYAGASLLTLKGDGAFNVSGVASFSNTLAVTGATTLSGKLTAAFAGGADYIAVFQNTTAGTPYGVNIKDAATPTNGYPLLAITDSTGGVIKFRVDSGTGGVAIGNGAPDTNALKVTGTVTISSTLSVTGAASFAGTSASVAASTISLGGITRTTIGANGAATALTANPLGYIDIYVAGVAAQIPYYTRGA